MQEWLIVATRVAVQVIDIVALAVLAIGTVEAAFSAARAMLRPGATNADIRHVWLRYARWLVAALTFQLAADIAETAIAPGWADIGRLGAIAVIRTFLDFFLERDVNEVRGDSAPSPGASPPAG